MAFNNIGVDPDMVSDSFQGTLIMSWAFSDKAFILSAAEIILVKKFDEVTSYDQM